MSKKKTHRIVPVHSAQPASRSRFQGKKPEDDIYCFSPIRIGRSSSPPSSEPRGSRYRTRQQTRNSTASDGEEDIFIPPPPPPPPRLPPPPGSPDTRSRHRTDSNNDDNGRMAKKRRFGTGCEVNCADGNSSFGCENEDHSSHSTQLRNRPGLRNKDNEVAKNVSSSSRSMEIIGAGHIVDSINKMAAEAREDRQEVIDTLKKLLRELQQRH